MADSVKIEVRFKGGTKLSKRFELKYEDYDRFDVVSSFDDLENILLSRFVELNKLEHE